MPRTIVRALALGCVGVALSACVSTQAQIDAGLNPATQSAAGMTAAGTTGAQLQQIAGYIKLVRDTAVSFCGIEPTVASVAAIAAAASGTSAFVVPAAEVATKACDVLRNGKIIPTAMEGKPAKKPAAAPKQGQTVTGTANINGQPVVVRGIVIDPSKAK
ncbi:hypothetical protein [Methylobacterium mesophilicum]